MTHREALILGIAALELRVVEAKHGLEHSSPSRALAELIALNIPTWKAAIEKLRKNLAGK